MRMKNPGSIHSNPHNHTASLLPSTSHPQFQRSFRVPVWNRTLTLLSRCHYPSRVCWAMLNPQGPYTTTPF
ncbi:hypothetical protein K438DRAFT_1810925 [Mycena galopus ATCC 62051]|nr:hypothetical protein K438DRAFT_1810925 [Mycena galopus ATCC 62051]